MFTVGEHASLFGLQSSSTLLPQTSVAPGLMIATVSLQSVDELADLRYVMPSNWNCD